MGNKYNISNYGGAGAGQGQGRGGIAPGEYPQQFPPYGYQNRHANPQFRDRWHGDYRGRRYGHPRNIFEWHANRANTGYNRWRWWYKGTNRYPFDGRFPPDHRGPFEGQYPPDPDDYDYHEISYNVLAGMISLFLVFLCCVIDFILGWIYYDKNNLRLAPTDARKSEVIAILVFDVLMIAYVLFVVFIFCLKNSFLLKKIIAILLIIFGLVQIIPSAVWANDNLVLASKAYLSSLNDAGTPGNAALTFWYATQICTSFEAFFCIIAGITLFLFVNEQFADWLYEEWWYENFGSQFNIDMERGNINNNANYNNAYGGGGGANYHNGAPQNFEQHITGLQDNKFVYV